jgi:hypothetical protein
VSAEPKLDLDLDAIEARIYRATPGPWRVKDQDPKQIHRGTVQVQEDGRGVEVIAECYCGAYEGHGLRNAELIARAPEDLQALIDEVRALRERAEKAEANYAFMVERAANQHLEGYRELGARAASAENEADRLRARLRETAQVLIAEVGADGPMDAEEAARKAVERMVNLRTLADEKAHEAGLYARRMEQAQQSRDNGVPREVRQVEELVLLRSELQEQARLVGMGSEREARLMAQLEEARKELQRVTESVMGALPATTVAFTGDYGMYVRACIEHLLLQELLKQDRK